MRITSSQLSRSAGVAAMVAGVLFAGIQVIHPTDDVASVPTAMWTVTGALTFTMAVLGLIGISGLYLRHIDDTGLAGLLGYVLLGVFFLLTCAFAFAETLILPVVVDDAPGLVADLLGIFNGEGSADSVGALAAVGPAAGGLYLVGGVLLGIALFRTRRVPRWAAGLLAAGAVASLLTAFLPHAIARFAALPVGIALIGLGASLWARRDGRRHVPAPSHG